MTDWKERAERAEAELARLRALLTRTIDHVSYGSRRSYDGVGGYKMREAASQLLLEIMAALAAIVAPPAQPAEPVQRLSDAGIEALAGKHGTTYRNRHFPTQPAFSFSNGSLHRFVRDIESAIQPQPGWRDIESAPKDGTDVWLHADGKVLRAFWLVKPYRETRDLDGNYIDHQDYDEHWMSCADGDEVEDPTEWQPLVTPLPPKATK